MGKRNCMSAILLMLGMLFIFRISFVQAQEAEGAEWEENADSQAETQEACPDTEEEMITVETLDPEDRLGLWLLEEENPVITEAQPVLLQGLTENTAVMMMDASSGHNPLENQKLVLTRIFQFWKRDVRITPLFRDAAHTSASGSTSTVLQLHRLGNISDTYPYLTHYIWAYCIEPNVSSDSWDIYQSTAQDAVELMLQIEEEAPEVYRAMIRTAAYAEEQAGRLSNSEAAALRSAAQTVIWQLICGMVSSDGERYLAPDGERQVTDVLYENISTASLALYDNYRQTNIASFTGTAVREKVQEIYAFLKGYEQLPSFLYATPEEACAHPVILLPSGNGFCASVTDTNHEIEKMFSESGTLSDTGITYERADNTLFFSCDTIPQEPVCLTKRNVGSEENMACFVYGCYSSSGTRKQSLLGECAADPVHAWLAFAPGTQKVVVVKTTADYENHAFVSGNPNYCLSGAKYGIFDSEGNIVRELILTDAPHFAADGVQGEGAAETGEELRNVLEAENLPEGAAMGIVVEGLTIGSTYRLSELMPPDGYLGGEDVFFTVSAELSENVIRVSDQPKLDPLDFAIVKEGPEHLQIPPEYLEGTQFSVEFYPEEAYPLSDLPEGEAGWQGIFSIGSNGRLSFYRQYCVSGIDTFCGKINPVSGAFLFPYGWLRIQESKASPGFAVNPDGFWVRLGEDGEELQLPASLTLTPLDKGVQVRNSIEIWGRIIGRKSDRDGRPLAGAVFELCSEDGSAVDENGRRDETFTAVVETGADGTFSWEGLAYGVYRVREVRAPLGYRVDERYREGILVQVTPDRIQDGTLQADLGDLSNEPDLVELVLTKHLERNTDYCSLESLPLENMTFRISGTDVRGREVRFTIALKEGDVLVHQMDEILPEYLSFQLGEPESSDEEEVQSVRILGLFCGSYRVEEITEQALGGYKIPEVQSVNFMAADPGTQRTEVPELEFTNILRKGSVKVLKRSAETEKTLRGFMVELQVKDYVMDWEEMPEDLSDYERDDKGLFRWRLVGRAGGSNVSTVVFDELTVGDYRIVETMAPTGYQLLKTPIEFSIRVTDPASTTFSRNFYLYDRALLQPPASGGTGPVPYYGAGGAMLLMGAAGLFLLRRRS